MPIYELTEELIFPEPSNADPEGALAIGGDLSPDRLILAYQMGIFPWFSGNYPIIWWAPDPRFVLFPHKLKVSKSMKKILRKEEFKITFDTCFREVIEQCRLIKRKGQYGTWITPNMLQAYENLHRKGLAHSVEVWKDCRLVGGLYGVSLGKCFYGESMFSHISNASKTGFITLVQELIKRKFSLIDCQVYTRHLESLGAEEIPRVRFLTLLEQALVHTTFQGSWEQWPDGKAFD